MNELENQKLMDEVQVYTLLQAFIGIVKKEYHVELWPIMDSIHAELMEVAK